MNNSPPRSIDLRAVLLLAGAMFCPGVSRAQSYEEPPINYARAPADDPITRLQALLDAGQRTLDFDPDRGYLPALLRALEIPASSQVLVFSKTSFQQKQISPRTPRALYFSDDVYIGWVQGGDVMEIAAADPQQGATFYTLRQKLAESPKFTRHTHDCLQCHESSLTRGYPGHLVRSVYPDEGGFPVLAGGSFVTDHTSPLRERWGGWYVTGTHGSQRHMGNAIVADRDRPEELDVQQGANLTDLSKLFPTTPYLTPHSDLVALLVLEHQTQIHNQLTACNFSARLALRDNAVICGMMDRPPDELTESTQRRLSQAAERLLEWMLLCDETPLQGPLAGTTGFAREFAGRGPRDARGRSLRDLDLGRRLFRYPCSYLIYSEAFDGLPAQVKEVFYRRLWEVVTGRDETPRFAHLSDADRQAILEILGDTRSGLPDYWSADS